MACMTFFVLGFFCRWQPRPDHMVCVTFFIFHFFLPGGNHGQTRRRAWHFLFFPLFCWWWPWPDHMASVTFFVIPWNFGQSANKARLDGVSDIFRFSYFLPMTAMARPYGKHDIFLFFPKKFAHRQIRPDQMACVTFFLAPFFRWWQPWPNHMVFMTFFAFGFFRWQPRHTIFCAWHFFVFHFFWPHGNHGQTRRHAWHFLYFLFFCRWWPRPDHMASMIFFVFPQNFGPLAIKARPDGMRNIFHFSPFFANNGHGQTLWRAWHFLCWDFFFQLTATARPYGMRDIFHFSLFLPDGNHGQTRRRTWHICFPLFFANDGHGQTIWLEWGVIRYLWLKLKICICGMCCTW